LKIVTRIKMKLTRERFRAMIFNDFNEYYRGKSALIHLFLLLITKHHIGLLFIAGSINSIVVGARSPTSLAKGRSKSDITRYYRTYIARSTCDIP
jgi:hypothetical protein